MAVALLALLALLIALAIILPIVLSGGNDKNGAKSASLTAGGTSILSVPPGSLKPYVGRNAQGAVAVQAVNDHAGFWVGTDAQHRLYVEWGGKAGEAENGSRFEPKVGQKVNVSGPIQAAPRDVPGVLKIGGADEQLVRTEGAFLNANTVTPAR